ncbi:hypothetical protein WLX35_15320, partial [Bordetella bronchiseptica]
PGPDRVVVFQEFDQLPPWKTVRENVPGGGQVAADRPAHGAQSDKADAHRRSVAHSLVSVVAGDEGCVRGASARHDAQCGSIASPAWSPQTSF